MTWLPLATAAALLLLAGALVLLHFRQHTHRQAGSFVAAAGGTGLFLMALAAVTDGGGYARGDLATLAWMRRHASPPLETAADILAILGSLTIVGPVLLAIAYVLWKRKRPGPATTIVAAVAAQVAISSLKLLIGRPRPEDPLSSAFGLSFPSGHATLAALVAFFAVWLAAERGRPAWVLPVVAPLAVTWLVLVASSRMLLGVHYLSDVTAGTGLGLAVGGFSASLPALVRSKPRKPRAAHPKPGRRRRTA